MATEATGTAAVGNTERGKRGAAVATRGEEPRLRRWDVRNCHGRGGLLRKRIPIANPKKAVVGHVADGNPRRPRGGEERTVEGM